MLSPSGSAHKIPRNRKLWTEKACVIDQIQNLARL